MTAASDEKDSSGGAPVKEGDILASKYRVEKVLGVGGMGVVVAAHHVDLDQRVALKFLLPTAASNEELVGRFMREARASVRLKGRHVAKVLDVGRLDDDAPYIVMEFLEGSDLTGVLKSRPPGSSTIEEAVAYILHACEGLAEAHSLGIIHRDLKPGNLFLTVGVDGKPLVKVLDFGISKTIDRSITGEAASLTKTEMLLGSPLYMSPEQMRSSKHVDERADIWALGAILYEMLTGTVPFLADTIMGLCFAVAQEQPKSPQEKRPDIPDGLCAAILRCLEKDPAKRWANVAELAQAIEPFGPQRTRGTAERALDVLGAGRRKPMHSIPDADPSPNPTSDPTISASTPSPMARSDATPAPNAVSNAVSNSGVAGYPFGSTSDSAHAGHAKTPTPSVSNNDVAAQAAWGGTRAEPKPKMPEPAKRGWVLPVGVAVVVVAAIGGVAAFKGTSTPPTNNLSMSNTVPPTPVTNALPSATAPVAAGGTGAPTAAPSESVQTTPTAPVASSAPSATAAGPGKVPVRPGGSGTGGKLIKPAGGNTPAVSAATGAPTSAPTATAAPAASGGFIRERE
ncbi:MAG: protein kinase [Deltaproteobacteria bacterium]|nr:protein kinase [Deltaproteobacteria bacterium]